VQLPILDGVDLHALLLAAATDGLGDRHDRLPIRGHACAVALASEGYPGKVSTDKVVKGLDSVAGRPNVHVFHAGTKVAGNEVQTSGGRVLYVVGVGESLPDAVATAYGAIGPDGLSFDGMQYRRDIAARALA
jgi:phosphoribosylamine-glycine ligase